MAVLLGEQPALVKPRQPVFAPDAPVEVVHEAQRLLYREARLLDDERYDEWLGLLTPDIHYWMPGVQALYRKDKLPRYSEQRMAFFDDDLLALRRRVTRFMHETAWAEDPPTRHCHVVSAVEVELTANRDEYLVHSTFVNCRGRNEAEQDVIHGRRQDILRRGADGTLLLARRVIYVTQAVLLAKNLNTFL